MVGIQCIQRKKYTNHHIYIRPHEIISGITTTSNIVSLYECLYFISYFLIAVPNCLYYSLAKKKKNCLYYKDLTRTLQRTKEY